VIPAVTHDEIVKGKLLTNGDSLIGPEKPYWSRKTSGPLQTGFVLSPGARRALFYPLFRLKTRLG
jgi:hypothetical protein